jgi:hypothetical protein
MGFRKFGTGDDQKVEPEDQDPQIKTAAKKAEWSETDQRELDKENER